MKKLVAFILSFATLVLPAVSFAAGINLYNGGFGQIAGDTQNFGVAVCNGGEKTVDQPALVSVAVAGQTAAVLSASPLPQGSCGYSYLNYSQLGMQAGGTYSVTATIDPGHTLISNSNNQAVYRITVPRNLTITIPASNETAIVNTQSGDFFTMLANWFTNIWGVAK